MYLQDGKYFISNLNILDICKKYDTPLYLYDANKIISQYSKLVSSFDVKNLKILYAAKALTNINILKLFNKMGSGLDTVSIEEVKIGIKSGFEPSNILFTPNSVSKKELEEAISLGVHINIDNIDQLEYFGHTHPETPICIRINPHIMAGGNSNISVGHIDSKFGISIHQFPLVQRLVKTLNINVEGLHMHTGSDILDVDVFLQAADILFSIAENFQDLKFIDFGSGFKVKYKPEDYETDIILFGNEISKKFNDFEKNYGKDLALAFEPGKFLVSEAGYFFVKTNLVKQTTSTVFAGVDSGFNHLIRPMFYNAYHEIINISNPEGMPRIYTVVGYICETDTFAWNRKISEIHSGDILAFRNAGAYGFTMSSNYNSRLRPAEVLIYEGKDYLIRGHETFEDLLRNQIEIEL
ncbi:MAG TPA: diaminopimelate decarboxylase [Candidatus Kapabacteria bacterium]|nr:diaminopimelate decarboxylase [Candidatus Kapabacteria bacterium]